MALEEKLNIRPVITMLNNYLDFQHVLTSEDTNKYPKRINAKKDWIGELTVWDSTHFEIVFELEQ